MSRTHDWLEALQATSSRLDAVVSLLDDDDLERGSFASEWTIADVLSHLGSAAEICTTLVQRGVEGNATGPRAEDVQPVWARWNALSPVEQRAARRDADAEHRRVLSSVDQDVRIPYFSGVLDLPTYAGYRLSEQVVHGWDIRVAMDPGAWIPDDEVELLWERIDVVASRFHDAEVLARLAPLRVGVQLHEPAAVWTLTLDSEVHLVNGGGTESDITVDAPAEALLRLIYGRHRLNDRIRIDGDQRVQSVGCSVAHDAPGRRGMR